MSVTHWVVWEGGDATFPYLECVCGRKFVGRLAHNDLAAHLRFYNEILANAPAG